jgi:hypothetical protein
MFTNLSHKGKDKQEELTTKFLSNEYRKSSFELILLGSDDAVNAYNNMMQHIFHLNENERKENDPTLIILLSTLLLEMRKISK